MANEKTTVDSARPSNAPRSPLEKFLTILADTHAGEGVSALLLTLSVFALLTSYYLLKTAREPLILVSGAELKSYMSVGQTLILLPLTYLYGRLAQRVGRIKLITSVTIFFLTNIVLFFGLQTIGVPIGIPFFLWVGIFSMMIVAQFWSFAADIYTEAQGKRLFAILGVGSTTGAVAGSALARHLIHPIGVYGLMLAAAGFLVVSLALTNIVHRREKRAAAEPKSDDREAVPGDHDDAPFNKRGGFALLLADRYLLLIAALAFILNCANSNGEYILDRALLEHVRQILPAGADAQAFSMTHIGEFKANYFLYTNVATVVLQLFAVSRIIKYLGVRVALFMLPVVSVVGYSMSAIFPVIGLIFAVKISENTLDYSVVNTSRQALWLLTSRDEKYKAKNVIDSFVVRAGDALSAGITLLGTALHFATRNFIFVNIAIAGCGVGAMCFLAREHKRREAKLTVKAGDGAAPQPRGVPVPA